MRFLKIFSTLLLALAFGLLSEAAPVGLPLVSPNRKAEENLALQALAKSTPQDAGREHEGFHLPEGFIAELVADESVMHKAVAMSFDAAGRLWVTTAGEYPLDGNEQPDRAAALYRDGGKDAVLIFDTPCAPGLQKPRVFAGDPDGHSGSPFKLAMPLGVLPYKDGAIIQHGPDLLFLRDTKGTGMADQKEILLHGFGVDDSHLMQHGFTRGPGDWMYFAQGAFIKSHVQTKEGPVGDFTYCKVLRMKLDGSQFEIVGWGPCNVWGFVIDPRGDFWAQEANDYGFPLFPFEPGIAIPGIGSDRPHTYSPLMPPPVKLNDCAVGGTGLSGLALSEDVSTWPEPYAGAFILANPITNRLQVMRARSTQPGYDGAQLEMLGDLLKSDDPQFRPVAVRFGPDGALYVNDWYNKIISHNEVARNHPERDKARTRLWRIRWTGAANREIPNLHTLPPAELIDHLGSANAWEANAARCELSDRGPADAAWPAIADELTHRLHDPLRRVPERLGCFWALEGAHAIDKVNAPGLLSDRAPELRREAVRMLGEQTFPKQPEAGFGALLTQPGTLDLLPAEQDPRVRLALIHAVREVARAATRCDGHNASLNAIVQAGSRLLLSFAQEPSSATGPDAEGHAQRAFERAEIRGALELRPADVAEVLKAGSLSPEGRRLGILALPPADGAARLAGALGDLPRMLSTEEMALLSGQIAQPAVREALGHALNDPASRRAALAVMVSVPPGNADLSRMIVVAAWDLLASDPKPTDGLLVVRLARVHRLVDLEPQVVNFAGRADLSPADLLEAVNALREVGSERLDLFEDLATRPTSDPAITEEVHRAAVSGLASARSSGVVPALAALWPQLPRALREIALDKVTSSKLQAVALVRAVRGGQGFTVADLDDVALDKLSTVLGENQPNLDAILEQAKGSRKPVLRLTGKAGDLVETGVNLSGPFTVETWINLDAGISNEDSILGAPGGAVLNFFDSHFRIYIGRDGIHDALVARTAMRPNLWTHVAITRDEGGHFRIYLQGELDAEGGSAYSGPLTGLDIGRNSVAGGCGAMFTEFRIWDIARSPAEILDNYQRTFAGAPRPAHLAQYWTGAGPWGKLAGQAHILETRDFPELLSPEAARELEAKFARFRRLIAAPGDAGHGHALFVANCEVCHRAKGEGAQIGPELSGAGVMGDESLLRNILTPNERIESGYYRFDVEMKNGDLATGFFIREDASSVVLRPIGADDRVIPRSEIRETKVARKSIMPEGLLDAMAERDVADLFAFLRTLH